MTNKQFNSFNKKIGELANENDLLIRVNGLQRQKIKKLEEENEQLRQQLSNATELYKELDVKNQICRKEKEDFERFFK